MSHLVLARKFRPQNFANVVGQEHIRRVLKNSLKRNKVAHAYLFAGPRGVGKTSLARIFAKSLNCQALKDGEPCLACPNCIEIAQGISISVREIDGASHNSVENVRELIENFRALPPPGSIFKVYIIDEVHMLSTSAFNALLKSLEEPPPNTVFILATTEVHKIPETVISRCQRHDFRSIDLLTIENTLDAIIQSEGRKAESGVTKLIARYSDGSLRDSQSLLERIMAYSDDDEQQVSVEAARQVLGVAGPAQIESIWNAIQQENASQALELLSEVFKSGVDTSRFLKEFVESIRSRFQNAVSDKLDAAQILELEQILTLATRGSDSALRSLFSEASLESLVVRLSLRRMREKPGARMAVPPASGQTSSPAVAVGTKTQPANNLSAIPQINAEGVNAAARSEVVLQQGVAIAAVAEIDWEKFLMSPGIAAQRILVEHLKRIAIEKFVVGELTGVGPDFSVECLKKPENLARLQTELNAFSPTAASIQWKISFNKQGVTSGGSVYEKEKAASKQLQAEKQKSAIDHPSVKSLQRAFPGSSVSKVSIRK